jgi:hypothetical protein
MFTVISKSCPDNDHLMMQRLNVSAYYQYMSIITFSAAACAASGLVTKGRNADYSERY